MYKKMIERNSIRKFEKYDMQEEELNKFIDIVNASPTSINGNHFSCIFITDQDLKNQLSNIGFSQTHIRECSIFAVFLIDLTTIVMAYENSCEYTLHNESIPNLILSSIVDATIAATMLQDYAISQNYGTCWIGAIRSDMEKAKQILNLPNYIFPFVALCIGKNKQEKVTKNKLNKVFVNKYSEAEYKQRIIDYDNKSKDDLYTRSFFERIQQFYAFNSKYINEMNLEEINRMLSSSTYINLFKK